MPTARIDAVTALNCWISAARSTFSSASDPRRQVSSIRRQLYAQLRTTPFWRILQPAEPLSRKVAEDRSQGRHGDMPFRQHRKPLAGRVIAPVGELRAHGEDAADQVVGRRQSDDETADAVGDDMDRLAGKRTVRVPQDGVKIQVSPIQPGRLKAGAIRRA